eukprot:11019266-Alexandrium_andersonii.AAC.1
MPTRFGRSELEPRGPRNGFNIDLRTSRGVRFAVLLALIPNLTTKEGVLEVPRGVPRLAP